MNLVDVLAVIALIGIITFAILVKFTERDNTSDHGTRNSPPRRMPKLPSYSMLDNDRGQDDDKIIFREDQRTTKASLLDEWSNKD